MKCSVVQVTVAMAMQMHHTLSGVFC